jgi:hypothetical protein
LHVFGLPGLGRDISIWSSLDRCSSFACRFLPRICGTEKPLGIATACDIYRANDGVLYITLAGDGGGVVAASLGISLDTA